MAVLEGQTFQKLQLKVRLPKEVGFASDSIKCIEEELLDRDPECTIVKEADGERFLRVVFVGLGGERALSGAATLSFLVAELRNPYSTAETSSFRIELLDLQGYKIAT